MEYIQLATAAALRLKIWVTPVRLVFYPFIILQ